MDADTEIVCSLTAAELPHRLAEMRAIGRDALRSVNADGELRFHSDQDTRERLEAIIAAESTCCSFLSFDLREENGELLLTIDAPDDARPLVLALISVFAGDAEAA